MKANSIKNVIWDLTLMGCCQNELLVSFITLVNKLECEGGVFSQFFKMNFPRIVKLSVKYSQMNSVNVN